MRQVAPLAARWPKAVPLDGLCENNGRLSLVLICAFISVVNLDRVVTATAQLPEFFVAHVVNERCELGRFAEEFFPQEFSVFGSERLKVAIHALFHSFEQNTLAV